MAYKSENKPDYSLLVKEMLDPVARVMGKGEGKHGRRNYLDNPAVTDLELIAAAGRHWAQESSVPGSIDDGEGGTGESHVACMVANGLMLLHRRAAAAQSAPAPAPCCTDCGDPVRRDLYNNLWHEPPHRGDHPCGKARIDK